MKHSVPHETLSAQFSERLAGHELLAAVFTTYQFDPAFFEQEILPAFIDAPLSHVAAIRLVQLEEALRNVHHGLAVYYDHEGLVPSDAGAARLDVARIPVRHPTGCFHPKNVILLSRPKHPDEHGAQPERLLVACLSANLTQTGWWENVEAAHVEAVDEGSSTWLRDDVRGFLKQLVARSPKGITHEPLDRIRAFLGKKTEPRTRRSSGGRLYPRMWSKSAGPIADFLGDAAAGALEGMHLDVIAPYFDAEPNGGPLESLLDTYQPKRVHIHLPRERDGTALVSEAWAAWVRERPECAWAELPADLMSTGASADAQPRFVHAKVLRFFSPSAKREVVFVGSPNLTRAAHLGGGNEEAAFLVDVELDRRPESWLAPIAREPRSFKDAGAPEETESSGVGSNLAIRFRWGSAPSADVYWNDAKPSPALRVSVAGSPLFRVDPLEPRSWQPLPEHAVERLATTLRSTSLVSVAEEGSDTSALVLVQEEGMHQKPSLLHTLAAADILKYWALLTDAQRAAFLEARAAELGALGGGHLVPRPRALESKHSMFDRFAGFFHAFSMLEGAVEQALEESRERDAAYRLFGKKYDSLGTLLEKVAGDGATTAADSFADPLDRYLIALCADQLVKVVSRTYPDFWRAHAAEADEVVSLVRRALRNRERLLVDAPERDAFLAWYERQFLKRAQAAREQAR